MTEKDSQGRFGSAHLISLGALALGLILTWLGVSRLEAVVQQNAQAQFDRLSARVESDINRRIQLPLFALRGLAGLYSASDQVTREDVKDFVYSLDIDRHFPGVRGIGHIVRVPRVNLDAFIADERNDRAPDFTVKTKGDQPDLYVIHRIEPIERNRAALGLDVGQEARRRQGVTQAIATGRPTLTHRITLVQDQKKRPGLLLFVPVYKHNKPLDRMTNEERLNASLGAVYTPLVLEELMQGLMDVSEQRLDIRLEGLVPGEPKTDTLYEWAKTTSGPAAVRMTRTSIIKIGDREWSLTLRSNANFEAGLDYRNYLWLAVGGGVLSVLVSLVLWLMSTRRDRAEALAAEMTQDLERLAQIVRLTSNAAIIMDREQKISWVNEGFTRLYGFSQEEALGQTMGALVGSEQTDPANLARIEQSVQDGVLCRVEVFNRDKFGHIHCIDTEIQPVRNRQGVVTGFIELAQDVTALKDASTRMEAALRETQAFLHTINTQAIVSVADAKGCILEVNDAFCEVSGYSREELIGQDHRIVNSGIHPKPFWTAMWRDIVNGRPWRSEIANRSKDGRIYWVDSMITPIMGVGGRVEKFISIRTDITQRKLDEAQLHDSKAFLDRASHIAGVGGWSWDIRSKVLYWTDGNCHIYDREPGYQPDPAKPLEHYDEGSRQRLGEVVRRAIKTGEPWDLELQATTAKGRTIWVRNVGQVEYEGDQAVRLVGASVDITAQRQARISQAKTTALLTSVLDSASEISIIATDVDLCITIFNTGAERLLGYRADEMVGIAHPQVFHDEAEVGLRLVEMSAQLGRHLNPSAVFTDASVQGQPREWTYIRKDGSRVAVSLVVTPQHDADGNLIGYLGVAQDITQQRAYEDSLRQAMLRAEQANLSKSQFLANMSHEIRTPMHAIIGMLKLLHRTELSPRQLDYSGKAEGAAKSLLALLNDILDFSKVEAGKMSLDLSPFSVEDLLRNMAVILSASVANKPVEVLFDIDPKLPEMLIGDALRLQQVLINLGGNAVKFTARGDVVLGMALVSGGTDTARVRVWVRDTGIGIAPEALHNIFDAFTQAEASTTRKFGGTGLGLAISQRLVSLMGGRIAATSELGRGSEFSFEIELKVAQNATTPGSRKQRAMHVLAIDDNPTARQILAAQVASLGWDCDVAEGGQRALEMIQAQAEAGRHYDAIFMDWQMPGMDGWEASAHIRALEHGKVSPLIVMVTAHDRETLTKRSSQEQTMLDAYLVKPVTAAMLRDAVCQLLSGSGHEVPELPRTPTGRLPGLRILLAEDNPNNQQIAMELLGDEGAILTLAGDGLACVRCMQERDADFDIILMDIQMPVMDGLTAARRLRELFGDRTPPIIAMTANVQECDRIATQECGMVAHVGKPFDLDELIQVLRLHAKLGELEGTDSAPPPAATDRNIVDIAANLGVNVEAAIDRLGGRQDVYRRLLSSFTRDLDGAIAKLDTWWAGGQTKEIEQWAHAIKGLSGTLGHQRLSSVMGAAEAAVRSGAGAGSTPPWLHEVKESIPAAQAALDSLLRAMAAHDAPAAADERTPCSLDLEAVKQNLAELTDALMQSDMKAIDMLEHLRTRHGSALGDKLNALNEAMDVLDFDTAARECAVLIEGL